jgi:hypothetical protein
MSSSPSSPKSSLNEAESQRLKRLQNLGDFLDNAITIPGTSYRIGFDPILGLLPGAGDFVAMMLSVYIVMEAVRFGLPKSTVFRMVVNLVLDALLGAFPLLGDLFDFAWKANSQNLALLKVHLQTGGDRQHQADQRFTWLVGLGLVVTLGAIAIGLFFFIWWIIQDLLAT